MSLGSVVFAGAVSCCDTRPQTPDVDGYQHDRDVKRVASETRPAVDWILLRRLLCLSEPQSPSRKLRSDFDLSIFLGGGSGVVSTRKLKALKGNTDGTEEVPHSTFYVCDKSKKRARFPHLVTSSQNTD